ncbi:alpha/beta fold hydrolase [Pseudomonas sp. LRF_L74]|uniref:alpha/beta fold hydrolase n=1 Tax=Pseudomonas sp. LRF_L74 TaxID=3369422 RepID=UPI003F5EF9CF
MTHIAPAVPLLYLTDDPDTLPQGVRALAEQWPLQTPSVEQAARQLDDARAPVVLLSDTQHARHAIDLAQRHAAQVHALVLLSPPPFEEASAQPEADALAGGEVATLLLHGSELNDDEQARRAYAYKQAWPQAQLVYLYAAGADIAQRRPAAFAEVVGDFIRYQEGFVINRASTLLNP